MTDLVKYQAPDVMTLGATLARSGYFQDARDAAQAVVKILAGQELGFGPVASMTGIYIVKGKVSLSANLIAASVKRGKYNYRVMELTDLVCKIDFYEGKEKIGESAFTMEDAKSAGLTSSDNYKKFPRNMLFARAMSNGAKWYCADVFGGPVYTPDELGATVDGETGEMTKRPADEVIAPPAPPLPSEIVGAMNQRAEQGEIVDENHQRAILLGKIQAHMDMTKAKQADRLSVWRRYLPAPHNPETAPIPALKQVLYEYNPEAPEAQP